MLFAAEINYEGKDVNTIVQRFADVAGEDEFPEGSNSYSDIIHQARNGAVL